MKHCLSTFTLCMLFLLTCSAQDGHYWPQQYGAFNSMTAGAFRGSNSDNSAMYYNPGGLAFMDGFTIGISANAFQYFWFDIKNAAGAGNDLSYNTYLIIPQIISGSIPIFKQSKWRFSYSLITKDANEIRATHYKEYTGDLLPDIPGQEEFVGLLEWEQIGTEQWGGLGIAYKISDHFGVGISNFIAFRIYDYQFKNNRSLFTSLPSLEESIFVQNNEFVLLNNIAWIPKLGLTARFHPFYFGLTYTLPNVNLLGGGDLERTISLVNVPDLVINGEETSQITAKDRQENLDGNLKYPHSIALSGEVHGKKLKVALSAEYFFKIKPYPAIRSAKENVIRPSYFDFGISQKEFLSAGSESGAFFNWGIGVTYELDAKRTLLAGFHIDNSAIGPRTINSFNTEDLFTTPIFLSRNPLDYYHFGLGISLKRPKGVFTIGVNYVYGSRDIPFTITNFDDIEPNNFLEGTTDIESTFSYQLIAVVFGYVFWFDKEE